MAALARIPLRSGALILAALALLVAGWLVLSPPRAIEAGVLLSELARGEVPLSVPASLSWQSGGAAETGDLYRPPQGARAALLLVPGAAETGKDDPRLVSFARGLAAHGVLVLVPDLPGPKALRVGHEDIGEIADAAAYLLSLPHGAGPLGIAAISYGVGPAILAALEPRLRERVGFLVALGGYYDATSVLTFFTTGYWRRGAGGPWQLGRPNAYGKWVFVLANASRLDSYPDRERLEAIARQKLANLDADVSGLEESLGPQGRAVMALLDNRDPLRVPELIATLPERIQAEIAALDLAGKDLSGLHAQVLLIHGRDDAIVPYSESIALATALGPRAHLYLLDRLAHASLTPGDLADAWRLWRAAVRLLSLRDGG
ncbi:MAG TPA: alpha/beta hydrolase [Alphaproteobacteria bacterium]|nr:alpha/beta hydrolase [Alphaproteobacteria bacterium]